MRATDLTTVSADRRDAELLRLAGEGDGPGGFQLLAAWGLLDLRDGGIELAAKVSGLLGEVPWAGSVERDRALLAAALGPAGRELELADARPERPSECVALAGRHNPIELLLARALGAEWLDRYTAEWRDVTLEIDGDDLIAAGLEPGPALGRGLEAALRRKLDGEIEGREVELAVALETARSIDGVA